MTTTPSTAPADATRMGGPAEPNPSQQWLRLGVGERPCAVPIERVCEILQVGRLTRMPRTPDVVRGVMNLRGAVVPVIDLGERLFDRPVTVGRRSCIVIVEVLDPAADATCVMGLLVDAVYEVAEVPAESIGSVPKLGTPVAPAFLQGIHPMDSLQVQLLDLDAVLAPDELAEAIGLHAASEGPHPPNPVTAPA